MHRFDDLVFRGTSFTLNALDDSNSEILEELQTNGSSIAVKNLQMIQLQKIFFAVGMLSYFDSYLQSSFSCRSGFEAAKEILIRNGNTQLHDRFDDFICAINVLKHGHGRSYEALVARYGLLPFRIKLPGESFFDEGDVSEISSLIEVDNQFILNCAEVIELVLKEIRKGKHDSSL